MRNFCQILCLLVFAMNSHAAELSDIAARKLVGRWRGTLTFTGSENRHGSSSEDICHFKASDLPPAESLIRIRKIRNATKKTLAKLTLRENHGLLYASDSGAERGGVYRYNYVKYNKPKRKDVFRKDYYFDEFTEVNGVTTVTVIFGISDQYISRDRTGRTYCGMTYYGTFTKL